MRFLLAIIAIFASVSAMASGFYVPWWGEALLWLISTPEGWVATTGGLIAILAVILAVVKKY